MDTAERVDTADQDAWQDIARGVREGIRQKGTMIPAMTPAELKDFMEAAGGAYWLSVNAASFDKKVELEQARIVAAD